MEYDKFVPGVSRKLMLEPGTRIMIFNEDEFLLASAVDSTHCVQGETLEALKFQWELICNAYQTRCLDENIWEPPKPFEYEAVWESGTPIDFIDGLETRRVDYNAYRKADAAYHVRYKSYGLGLTDEEKDEWRKKKAEVSK